MRGLDYIALRYFNVYGPRMDIHGVYTEVLVRWMERIAAGEPPLIFGDGSQTMDFISTQDIARAKQLNPRALDLRAIQGRAQPAADVLDRIAAVDVPEASVLARDADVG